MRNVPDGGFYRIGIDVGERSVGVAAIAYDHSGNVSSILSCVSHIHDGGSDPNTAKSPLSRKFSSGVARRARRLLRNRKRRLKSLDELLTDLGFVVPTEATRETYEAWKARARLSLEYVKDETERKKLLVRAVRHLARHRGWRNPWQKIEQIIATADGNASEGFRAILKHAHEDYGVDVTSVETLGQLGAITLSRKTQFRSKHTLSSKSKPKPSDAILCSQIRQEDSLRELLLILRKQRLSDVDCRKICEGVFAQEYPHVPLDRIGEDPLPGMKGQVRAPRASLEFQEFRIRQTVANLRVRTGANKKRILSPDENDRIVDGLLKWRDTDRPSWSDVAEWISLSRRDLISTSIDDGGGSWAPVDKTSLTVEKKFPKLSMMRQWWDNATFLVRADLIALHAGEGGEFDDGIHEFQSQLGGEEIELLASLQLEAGRAEYSRQSLARLNSRMSSERCDLHTARKLEFDVPDDWAPPVPSLEEAIDHPTVDRVLTIVRRFVLAAVQKWGTPERIVIEHVRSSFFGPTALAEYNDETESNRKRNEAFTEELRNQGIDQPRKSDIRRYRAIQLQNGKCLYCGTMITANTSEMDHIVASSKGGSSRAENLVAVCRPCNGSKGKIPFAIWAQKSPRPGVNIEKAIERLEEWDHLHEMPRKRFAQLKKNIKDRLLLTSDDELDERSLASTAFAAREIRARLDGFLGNIDGGGKTWVYSGNITAEARKSGGIASRINLRGKADKSRFDRRHHAIDAAVIATITNRVAEVLSERSELKRANDFTGKYQDWKGFAGDNPEAKSTFLRWKDNAQKLAELLVEDIKVDLIPVMRPLRLSPHYGMVHKATVEALEGKNISGAEGITSEDFSRIADIRIYRQLLTKRNASGGVDADVLHQVLPGSDSMAFFPSSTAPFLAVRGGAVAIGETAKAARLYAWKDGVNIRFGMIRLFSGEFPKIGFGSDGIDLYDALLPEWSQSIRHAEPNLRKAIQDCTAVTLGWITVGDELEIDVHSGSLMGGKIGDFLSAVPEKRWIVTGFLSNSKLSIAPAYLAKEGIGDDTPEIVAQIVRDNRIPLAINVVLEKLGVTVIRRTVLGKPRWRSEGLPTSFQPRDRARTLLKIHE